MGLVKRRKTCNGKVDLNQPNQREEEQGEGEASKTHTEEKKRGGLDRGSVLESSASEE